DDGPGLVVPGAGRGRHPALRVVVPHRWRETVCLRIAVAGFLDVLLRGLGLCGQTVAIGGILLGVLVLRPIPRQGPGIGATKTALLLVAGGAAAMILALAVALAIQLGALVNEDGWPVSAVFATTYFRASMVKSIVCMLVIGAALSLRRRAPSRAGWMSLAAL